MPFPVNQHMLHFPLLIFYTYTLIQGTPFTFHTHTPLILFFSPWLSFSVNPTPTSSKALNHPSWIRNLSEQNKRRVSLNVFMFVQGRGEQCLYYFSHLLRTQTAIFAVSFLSVYTHTRAHYFPLRRALILILNSDVLIKYRLH